MKFCLRHYNTKYLNEANEIYIHSLRVEDKLLDLVSQYPNATFIIDDNDDIERIKRYKVLTKNKLIIRLSDFSLVQSLKDNDIPFFYTLPITTYAEYQALKDIGVESFIIDSPLFNNIHFFDNDKIRIALNVSYYATIPRKNGIIGSWVRPEDLDIFGDNVIGYFENCDAKKEEALYRVYSNKEWLGNLNNLITNLNYNVENVLIPPELIDFRTNCRQRCLSGRGCRLCHRYFAIANKDFLDELKELSNGN